MPEDTTPVIAAAVRTPQGKEDGVFADVRAEDLSIPLINHILDEHDLGADAIDDLMWARARPRRRSTAGVPPRCSRS